MANIAQSVPFDAMIAFERNVVQPIILVDGPVASVPILGQVWPRGTGNG